MIIQPIVNIIVWSIFILALAGSAIVLIKQNNNNNTKRKAWIRRLVIIALLFVVGLRPGIGSMEDTPIYANQYNIYFVVDTSGSMNAEDWVSEEADNNSEEIDTRLNAVKVDIEKLITQYSGARYALIGFDSSGTVRVPLTTDSSTVMSGVKILQTEITKNSSGSSVSSGKSTLQELLEADMKQSPDKERIIFFFSDGEQTVAVAPESFEDLKPYVSTGAVYGYGTTTGGRMKPNYGFVTTTNQSEYIMDTTQNPPVEAISIIDETNLRNIASELGIGYQHRTPDVGLDIINLEESVYSESGEKKLKITADFSWILSIPLIIMLSIEGIFMFLTMRKAVLTRREQI
jgi:Ca-activated chloride channel family protein